MGLWLPPEELASEDRCEKEDHQREGQDATHGRAASGLALPRSHLILARAGGRPATIGGRPRYGAMLRLGHIEYSNCFPIHARFIDCGLPPGVELLTGVPDTINRNLASGAVDVAPASSIEYARNSPRYRILPELVIGSDGPVGSILLDSRVPISELDGAEVAVPTASATSVILLRVLLERRLGLRPRYRWFDQGVDPHAAPADVVAALWIGDVALRREPERAWPVRTDLGEAWTEWTGLPFAFAVWQVSAAPDWDPEVTAMHSLLLESRDYFRANDVALATRYAARYRLDPGRLLRYWRSLRFVLDDRMLAGLRRFFTLAAELGEKPAPELRWTSRAAS